MKKIVISLGGNALRIGNDSLKPQNQLVACLKTAKVVIDLVKEGHNIALVHGLLNLSLK